MDVNLHKTGPLDLIEPSLRIFHGIETRSTVSRGVHVDVTMAFAKHDRGVSSASSASSAWQAHGMAPDPDTRHGKHMLELPKHTNVWATGQSQSEHSALLRAALDDMATQEMNEND
jgi:hypothetical protein